MAGAKDKLHYEILEVSNPESLLIKGEVALLPALHVLDRYTDPF